MSDVVEVSKELVERCVGRMRDAGDTLHRQSGGRGRNGIRAERLLEAARDLEGCVGGGGPRMSEQMPPGYARTHTSGGYYEVTDPEGNVVPGPSNGKWQGKDGAAEGAWNDHESE